METHSWPPSCVDPLSPWHTLLTRPVISFCSFIWPRHCHLLASFPAPPRSPAFRRLQYRKAVEPFPFDFFVHMQGEPGNEASHLSLTTFSTSVVLATIVWFYWYTETCIDMCINMCITQSNTQIWYIVAPDIMVFLLNIAFCIQYASSNHFHLQVPVIVTGSNMYICSYSYSQALPHVK